MRKITYSLGVVALVVGLLVAAHAQAAGPRPQRGAVIGASPDMYNAQWVTGVSQDSGAKGQSLQLADFTGDRTNCTIYDSTGASYSSTGTTTAWSKLVAAYPNAKVWFMFLIQDATTGINYVDRITLDSAFFTKQP